ncbi:MAG: prepilin-type N-terminal cleavage/methylation domain-containing protein [Spirochaetes bacterium]|nr:prepilin-type N-terminal cleavage/methylation domain-containing protein [Spirochaetota bacterium]MBN2770651.1 prepilin-type N-terminal cleavage/methylation domain-containing protein [Spirochaetota bacterium]
MTSNQCGNPVFNKPGFALIEILIAVTVLSLVVLPLYKGISTGSMAISQNKNLTKAIVIARSKLNELKIQKMQNNVIAGSEVPEYPGFTYEISIEKFEHELLGPIPANIAVVTVFWMENSAERSYSIEYIYPL